MFKKLIILLMLLFVSTGMIVSVNADIGPKPTVDIEIIGFDEPYYFDILYKVDESRVKVLTEEEVQTEIEYDYYRDDFPNVLNGFQDNDGYASYTLYRGIPHEIKQLETHKFRLGYVLPPSEFKIVLVLDNDEMIVSNVVNKTLFNAEFTFDLSDFSMQEADTVFIDGVAVYLIDDPSPQEIIPWGLTVLQIFLAVIFTVLIELFILFVFRYNQKSSYKTVLYVNLLTQFVFHTILVTATLLGSFFGFVIVFIIGELIVLAIEMILYIIFFKEKSKLIAAIYALLANLISAVFGTLILGMLINLLI